MLQTSLYQLLIASAQSAVGRSPIDVQVLQYKYEEMYTLYSTIKRRFTGSAVQKKQREVQQYKIKRYTGSAVQNKGILDEK